MLSANERKLINFIDNYCYMGIAKYMGYNPNYKKYNNKDYC